MRLPAPPAAATALLCFLPLLYALLSDHYLGLASNRTLFFNPYPQEWMGKATLTLRAALGALRIIEWLGLEGTLKITWFQPPCHEQGHLPPDQVAQSSIQPGLRH